MADHKTTITLNDKFTPVIKKYTKGMDDVANKTDYASKSFQKLAGYTALASMGLSKFAPKIAELDVVNRFAEKNNGLMQIGNDLISKYAKNIGDMSKQLEPIAMILPEMDPFVKTLKAGDITLENVSKTVTTITDKFVKSQEAVEEMNDNWAGVKKLGLAVAAVGTAIVGWQFALKAADKGFQKVIDQADDLEMAYGVDKSIVDGKLRPYKEGFNKVIDGAVSKFNFLKDKITNIGFVKKIIPRTELEKDFDAIDAAFEAMEKKVDRGWLEKMKNFGDVTLSQDMTKLLHGAGLLGKYKDMIQKSYEKERAGLLEDAKRLKQEADIMLENLGASKLDRVSQVLPDLDVYTFEEEIDKAFDGILKTETKTYEKLTDRIKRYFGMVKSGFIKSKDFAKTSYESIKIFAEAAFLKAKEKAVEYWDVFENRFPKAASMIQTAGLLIQFGLKQLETRYATQIKWVKDWASALNTYRKGYVSLIKDWMKGRAEWVKSWATALNIYRKGYAMLIKEATKKYYSIAKTYALETAAAAKSATMRIGFKMVEFAVNSKIYKKLVGIEKAERRAAMLDEAAYYDEKGRRTISWSNLKQVVLKKDVAAEKVATTAAVANITFREKVEQKYAAFKKWRARYGTLQEIVHTTLSWLWMKTIYKKKQQTLDEFYEHMKQKSSETWESIKEKTKKTAKTAGAAAMAFWAKGIKGQVNNIVSTIKVIPKIFVKSMQVMAGYGILSGLVSSIKSALSALGPLKDKVDEVAERFQFLQKQARMAFYFNGQENANAFRGFARELARETGNSISEIQEAGLKMRKLGIGDDNIRRILKTSAKMADFLPDMDFSSITDGIFGAIKSGSGEGLAEMFGGGAGVERALRRAGINRKLRRADIGGALDILDKFQEKYGMTDKASKSFNDNLYKNLRKMSVELETMIGRVKMTINRKLMPFVKKALEYLQSDEFKAGFEKYMRMMERMLDVVTAIGEKIVDAVKWAINLVWGAAKDDGVWGFISKLIVGVKITQMFVSALSLIGTVSPVVQKTGSAIKYLVGGFTAAFKAGKEEWKGTKLEFQKMDVIHPIKWTKAAITAPFKLIRFLSKKEIEAFKKAGREIGEHLKYHITNAFDHVSNFAKNTAKKVTGFFSDKWSALKDKILNKTNEARKGIISKFKSAAKAASNAFEDIKFRVQTSKAVMKFERAMNNISVKAHVVSKKIKTFFAPVTEYIAEPFKRGAARAIADMKRIGHNAVVVAKMTGRSVKSIGKGLWTFGKGLKGLASLFVDPFTVIPLVVLTVAQLAQKFIKNTTGEDVSLVRAFYEMTIGMFIRGFLIIRNKLIDLWIKFKDKMVVIKNFFIDIFNFIGESLDKNFKKIERVKPHDEEKIEKLKTLFDKQIEIEEGVKESFLNKKAKFVNDSGGNYGNKDYLKDYVEAFNYGYTNLNSYQQALDNGDLLGKKAVNNLTQEEFEMLFEGMKQNEVEALDDVMKSAYKEWKNHKWWQDKGDELGFNDYDKFRNKYINNTFTGFNEDGSKNTLQSQISELDKQIKEIASDGKMTNDEIEETVKRVGDGMIGGVEKILGGLNDFFGGTAMGDLLKKVTNIEENSGKTKDNTTDIRQSLSHQADLRWMKEMAEQRFVNKVNVEHKSVNPIINLKVNSNANPKDLGDAVASVLKQQGEAGTNIYYGNAG